MVGAKAPKFLPPAAVGAEIERTASAAQAARASVQVSLTNLRSGLCRPCTDHHKFDHDLCFAQAASADLERLQDAHTRAQAASLEADLTLQSLKGGLSVLHSKHLLHSVSDSQETVSPLHRSARRSGDRNGSLTVLY